MVCTACFPNKVLTNEELLVSTDYCKDCLKIINADLDEFKEFLSSRHKGNDYE